MGENNNTEVNKDNDFYEQREKKKKVAKIIGIVAIVVAIIAAIVLVILLVGKKNKKDKDVIDIKAADKVYVPTEKEILQDESGQLYVDGIIIVVFDNDTPDKAIEKTIKSVKGKLVGKETSYVQGYQIRVASYSLKDLEDVCNKLLEEDDNVLDARPMCIYEMTTDAVILDDPWTEPDEGETPTWDEENPAGLNWDFEATKVPSAWEYSQYFNNINICVIDDGVDIDHEDLKDLNITLLNEDEADDGLDHGTHVTGIMAAKGNNGVGMAGVLQNVSVYLYDVYKTNADGTNQTWISYMNMAQAMASCVNAIEPGDKLVINISSGAGFSSDKDEKYQKACAMNSARDAIAEIALLLYNGHNNFLVFQSAGNGDKATNPHQGVDASYNGTFSSITEELVEEFLASRKKYAEVMTVEDIMNCIMVVAAVDVPENGEYKLTKFSNYGKNVTISAPGNRIYSTVVAGGKNGDYAPFAGTSMASPFAASVTALAWSVNKELTPGEIKAIIMKTATTPVGPGSINDTGDTVYYLIDAKAAVEEVIKTLGSSSDDPGDGGDNKSSGKTKKKSTKKKITDALKKDTKKDDKKDDDKKSDNEGRKKLGFYSQGDYYYDIYQDESNSILNINGKDYTYEKVGSQAVNIKGTYNGASTQYRYRIAGDACCYLGYTEDGEYDLEEWDSTGNLKKGHVVLTEKGFFKVTWEDGEEKKYGYAICDDDTLYMIYGNGYRKAEYQKSEGKLITNISKMMDYEDIMK